MRAVVEVEEDQRGRSCLVVTELPYQVSIERVVAKYAGHLEVKAFRQTGKGKNDAVRLGFSEATCDLLTILDADLTMPPEERRSPSRSAIRTSTRSLSILIGSLSTASAMPGRVPSHLVDEPESIPVELRTEDDIAQLRERRLIAVMTLGLQKATLNNPLDPIRGSAFSFEVAHSSKIVGSSEFARFTRLVGDASWYYPIGRMVVAAHVRAGAVLAPHDPRRELAARAVPGQRLGAAF